MWRDATYEIVSVRLPMQKAPQKQWKSPGGLGHAWQDHGAHEYRPASRRCRRRFKKGVLDPTPSRASLPAGNGTTHQSALGKLRTSKALLTNTANPTLLPSKQLDFAV
ncbi:hypothetical protein GCM10008955_32290 [Deinococcus malanensis]|uniref:Uncharacterized protein n=1 Tax=Deinococcus malanensis TaxID=1706855 RepID=A0ABQ2F3E5_9DEIO|nr:hypothetical protein GCM10008955_32290 [Deinococcus malanensis]